MLETLRRETVTALEGLTAAGTQLRTKDDPARWSIQQIVEHLSLTYALSIEGFAQRTAKGAPTKARPTVAQRMGQVVVLRLEWLPPGRVAPEKVMPQEVQVPLTGLELSERAHANLERFDALAAKAEGIFGDRRAISHQVLGPISVWQWRKFHLVHGRHHLRQIRAIRSAHKV